MKIAIKNPAPLGMNLERWGDFHFGKSLEAALTRQGAQVVQHFWPDWNLHEGEEAAIWLRGKRWCAPTPGIVNAIWILSHPSSISETELQGFDLVFAASQRLASELQDLKVRSVEIMRQCTDAQLFRTERHRDDHDRKGLIFVASSRGVKRPILQWALDAGLRPSLIGQGWNQVGVGGTQADYIQNAKLPELYNLARYGMNDHWGDMAHYQMINNRIFDCLACGLPVISDGFPELSSVAGEGVWIVDGPQSFKDAYWSMRLDYPNARKRSLQAWMRIGDDYTFDARATQILTRLRNHAARPLPSARATPQTPAVESIFQLIERLGGLGDNPSRITLSLLHIGPDVETSGSLYAAASLSTLTAGLGSGPWNVDLSSGVDGLGSRKFDLIYFQDTETMKFSRDFLLTLRKLVGHLKPGGLMSALDVRVLQELEGNPRLAKISDAPLIFRRTVEHFEFLADR